MQEAVRDVHQTVEVKLQHCSLERPVCKVRESTSRMRSFQSGCSVGGIWHNCVLLTCEASKSREFLWKRFICQHVLCQVQLNEVLAVAQAGRQLSQRILAHVQPATRSTPVECGATPALGAHLPSTTAIHLTGSQQARSAHGAGLPLQHGAVAHGWQHCMPE